MKVSIGRERHPRRPIKKDFDNNTTSDWGFMQPTLFDEVRGGSKVSLSVSSVVRLSPVVVPTFGRAYLKHYAYFVPIRDLQMSYENMMSGTIFNGGGSSYIPSSVPMVSQSFLTEMLLRRSKVRCVSVKTDTAETMSFQPSSTKSFDFTIFTFLDSGQFEFWAFPVSEKYPTVQYVTVKDMDYFIQNGPYALQFKFNRAQKHFRKILIGLGIQPNFDSKADDISLLPLFGYYKAWFDLFAVKRERNWQSTNCYKLIQYIAYHNIVSVPRRMENDGEFSELFYDFLDDLEECYYTTNPDWITAHTTKMNLQMEPSINSPEFITGADYSVYPAKLVDSIEVTRSSVLGAKAIQDYVSPVAIRMAQTMLRFVNKNTAIGQRIAQYFAAHGLGDVDDNKDVEFLGASSIDIDIDPVIQQAETAQGVLGELGGQGVGSGSSQQISKECPSTGFIYVLSCIIPRAGYVQGVNGVLHHDTRFKFYNPEFDAMFMQSTGVKDIYGYCDVCIGPSNRSLMWSQPFGLIPSYSEIKHKQNVANGDITLYSTRKSMMPYMLDRWFSTADLTNEYFHEDASQALSYTSVKKQTAAVPYADDALRYLGKDEVFGNFDRIFKLYNGKEPSIYDPFIVHNLFNYTVIESCIPMSDSFDTEANDNDITIEKA